MRSGDEHLPSQPARTSATPHPLDPTAAAQAIANRLLEVLASADAVVYRFDPDSGDLEVVAVAGDFGASCVTFELPLSHRADGHERAS